MIKFLIVEQDLRISGTSQGIISRSFLAKLRMAYPEALIDVVYLKTQNSDDQLNLLPVNSIESHVLDLRIPFFTKFVNRFYWRIFHKSLVIGHIHKVYGSYISKIDYEKYDHIFIRSAGLDCETILGAKNLPILKRAIITFNEPYPTFWCTGSIKPMTNLALFKLKEMFSVVSQAKGCMGTALLSQDMQYVYGSRKKFHVLPHHYCESVFDLSDNKQILQKSKKVTISYHGAIQFGRNIEILLDAYQELVKSNPIYRENTEFALRMKGIDLKKLAEKYSDTPNIIILDTLNFSNSCYEQQHLADINIILENGPIYCNILVGKAPFLAALKKPVFSLSPDRSDLRDIMKDERFIAHCSNKEEIKNKLENLIKMRLESEEAVYPFGDYFSDENFIKSMNEILSDKSPHLI